MVATSQGPGVSLPWPGVDRLDPAGHPAPKEISAIFEQAPHYGDVLDKLAAVLAAPPDSEAYKVPIQA